MMEKLVSDLFPRTQNEVILYSLLLFYSQAENYVLTNHLNLI